MTYYHISFRSPKWVERRIIKVWTRVDGESKIKTAFLKLTGSFAMKAVYLEPIYEKRKLTFAKGKRDFTSDRYWQIIFFSWWNFYAQKSSTLPGLQFSFLCAFQIARFLPNRGMSKLILL